MIDNIPDSMQYTIISKITKGWSEETKILIEDGKGNRQILRVMSSLDLRIKQKRFEIHSLLADRCSDVLKPLRFGWCLDKKHLFQINEWIEGQALHEWLPFLSIKEQYRLGTEIG